MITPSTPSQKQSAQFLSLWVMATFLGGFLINFLENNGLQFAATLLLSGAIIGSLQWIVLKYTRGFINICSDRRLRYWPLVSALGWITGTVSYALFIGLFYPFTNFLLAQLGLQDDIWLIGIALSFWSLCMAIAQSFLFNHRILSWPQARSLWLIASVVGGGNQITIAGVGWIIYAVVTGLAVLKLNSR